MAAHRHGKTAHPCRSPTPVGGENAAIENAVSPHREAILVLTDCRAQGNDTRADLVQRAYEDATHKHLDQVENIVLHPSDTNRL